jgi:hypothetical protein
MVKLLSMIALAGVVAGTPAPTSKDKQAEAKDPNRKICEMVYRTGSRFDRVRVCMTAQEWKDARDADRQSLERIQNGVCVPGAGC